MEVIKVIALLGEVEKWILRKHYKNILLNFYLTRILCKTWNVKNKTWENSVSRISICSLNKGKKCQCKFLVSFEI